MAGYKPKSLEEFNSIFNATLSAEEAIARGTSKIKEGIEADTDESIDIVSSDPAPVETESEIEDVSVNVDDFIKSFMAQIPASPKKPSVVTYAPEKPKASKEEKEEESIFSSDDEEDPVAEEISSEVSGEPTEEVPEEIPADISEWAKIMGDADEDESEENEHPRKPFIKKKAKKEKKAVELKETDEKPESDIADYHGEHTEDMDVFETLLMDDEEERSGGSSSKGSFPVRKVLRAVFAVLMVIFLSFTALIASLNLVFNVNTGKAAPGGYVFFTAAYDFAHVGVSANDLVVCKKSDAASGLNVAYIDVQNKTFCFGKKSDGFVSENIEILTGYDIIDGQPVSQSDVVGPIEKTIPTLGGYVSLILENYILCLSVLFALTVILAVVVIFVLRKKSERASDDSDDGDNDEADLGEEQSEEEFDDSADEDGASLFSDLD